MNFIENEQQNKQENEQENNNNNSDVKFGPAHLFEQLNKIIERMDKLLQVMSAKGDRQEDRAPRRSFSDRGSRGGFEGRESRGGNFRSGGFGRSNGFGRSGGFGREGSFGDRAPRSQEFSDNSGSSESGREPSFSRHSEDRGDRPRRNSGTEFKRKRRF